jgi:hypothetical protein
VLSLASPFGDLAELWLADLALRDIAESTKDNYRDDLRLHVRPFFENYALGEIATGRVEWFLKAEHAVSDPRAKHSRTVLSQLFSFALRHDAMPRNPVEGTSPLARPKSQIQALTLEQVQAIRVAAAAWRTGPGLRAHRGRGKPSHRASARRPERQPRHAIEPFRQPPSDEYLPGLVDHLDVVMVLGPVISYEQHRLAFLLAPLSCSAAGRRQPAI